MGRERGMRRVNACACASKKEKGEGREVGKWCRPWRKKEGLATDHEDPQKGKAETQRLSLATERRKAPEWCPCGVDLLPFFDAGPPKLFEN